MNIVQYLANCARQDES